MVIDYLYKIHYDEDGDNYSMIFFHNDEVYKCEVGDIDTGILLFLRDILKLEFRNVG